MELCLRAIRVSGLTMAQALREAGVDPSISRSIRWIREVYAQTTGRDFLPQALDGIDAAIAAGFPADQIELRPDARAKRRSVRSAGGIRRRARI